MGLTISTTLEVIKCSGCGKEGQTVRVCQEKASGFSQTVSDQSAGGEMMSGQR